MHTESHHPSLHTAGLTHTVMDLYITEIRSKYEMKQKFGCNHGNESVSNLSEGAPQSRTHSLTHESKLRKRKTSLSAVLGVYGKVYEFLELAIKQVK